MISSQCSQCFGASIYFCFFNPLRFSTVFLRVSIANILDSFVTGLLLRFLVSIPLSTDSCEDLQPLRGPIPPLLEKSAHTFEQYVIFLLFCFHCLYVIGVSHILHFNGELL